MFFTRKIFHKPIAHVNTLSTICNISEKMLIHSLSLVSGWFHLLRFGAGSDRNLRIPLDDALPSPAGTILRTDDPHGSLRPTRSRRLLFLAAENKNSLKNKFAKRCKTTTKRSFFHIGSLSRNIYNYIFLMIR